MGILKKSKEVEKEFKNKGYVLLEDYKKSNIPLKCEKKGLKGLLSYNNLKQGKNPGFFKFNNPYFIDNAQLIISKKNKDVKIIEINRVGSKYKRKILLKLKCSCGNIYVKDWDTIHGKKYVECNNCIKIFRGKNSRKDKLKTINFIESKGYNIINKNIDFRRNDYIEVINKNGYRGFVSYNKIKSGCEMSIFDIRINKSNYLYNINNYSKINNLNIRAIGFCDKKKWVSQGILLECSCGSQFSTSINSFRNGKFRCDFCSSKISSYEKIIKNYLEEEHIKFISEYRNNYCKDILPLPFDFYLIDYNKIIEVDGEGHYYPCNFNNISKENAIKTFNITKKHDQIKNSFCIKNNIELLRISYKDIKNEKYKEKIIQLIKD